MRHLAFMLLVLGALSTVALCGCETASPTQKGAMGGAAVGALGGQLIGGDTESTLIGATAGALGGALLNDHMSRQNP